MKINRPTAGFFTAMYYHFDGDIDAIGMAYDLVQSTGFTGYGRARRMEALEKVAPELAGVIQEHNVDILYVVSESPRHAYRTVYHEIQRGERTITEAVPQVCVALRTPDLMESWPNVPWRYVVWSIVNYFKMDDVDRATSGIPLPRDTRVALAAEG